MKKIALLTALTALSFANAEEGTVKQENPHNVFFGPVGFWQHFSQDVAKETIETDGVEYERKTNVTSDGFFGGAKLGYEHLKKDSIYFGLDGTFAVGRAKDEAKVTAKTDEVPNSELSFKNASHRTALFGNAESRIGYTLGGNSYTVSPFVGAGWFYEKPNTKDNFWADWFYGTAGFKSNFDLNDLFGIGLNAKARYNFAANAHFKDVKVTAEEMNNTWGYELGLPLTWHVGSEKNWDIQLEPYFSQLSTKLGDKQAGARLMFNCKF